MNTSAIVRRTVPLAARSLEAAGIDPVLSRIFAARGVCAPADVEYVLRALPDFRGLKGIAAMAVRLADAIRNSERLTIVADYDADGATACAVTVLGLSSMGARVDFLVPNRFEFGYGLTPDIVALAARRAPDVIITVDNGIASVEGVAAANALGIDVLITDHHLPGATLPAATCIVNPNQAGCTFNGKHLAGVGVMFYVLCALRSELDHRGHFPASGKPNLATLLDLVALGTVADVVKLDPLNRILVEQGLRRIRAGFSRPGLQALFAAAARAPDRATTYDLGFVVGPRLNAAGRLADMTIGIECLLAPDFESALPLARELDRLNRERREVETVMHQEALAAFDESPPNDAFSLCAYRPDWHQGVVGIVASRLKERYHRPTIVFARGSDGELRGSGRSIAGFHLRDALDLVSKRLPDAIVRFGGHAFAAGLTLRETMWSPFVDAFETVAQEWLTPLELKRLIETDGALSPAEVSLGLAEALQMQVWGQGFPAPLFDDQFAVLEQRRVGDKHLRLKLKAAAPVTFDAIAFNAPDELPQSIHAAYRLEANEYQGLSALQLVIEHWLPM